MRARSLFLVAICGSMPLQSCGPASSGETSAGGDGAATGVLLEEAPEQLQPIDSTFTIVQDLTGDGEPDSLELRILAASMEDPFEWTVRVWVRGEVVLEHESDDSFIDRVFGEEEFGGTGDRREDKASYYFDDLPNGLLRRDQFGAGHPVFDRSSPAGVYQAVARELHERGIVDEGTVGEIVERVVQQLQAGTVLLMIPRTPFVDGFPLVYIDEIGEFVPAFVW